MVTTDLVRMAIDLPPEERLELARRLIESVVAPETLTDALNEGVRRIEEVATGRARGLKGAHLRSPPRARLS